MGHPPSSNGVIAGRGALAAPGRRATLTIAMVTLVFPVHGGARDRAQTAATRLYPWVNIARSFSAS